MLYILRISHLLNLIIFELCHCYSILPPVIFVAVLFSLPKDISFLYIGFPLLQNKTQPRKFEDLIGFPERFVSGAAPHPATRMGL